MRKKFLACSAMAFGALGFCFCAVNANATSNDIVTKDEFVFNANDLSTGYFAGSNIASANGMTVKLGNNYQGNVLTANFDFGDYNFDYCLLANKATKSNNILNNVYNYFSNTKASNQNLAQYYISASEGTRCGVYYTVVDKTPVDNTYYVSDNNTIQIIKESKKNKYTTLDSFTEQVDYMYYSEFTFGNQGTVGLMSDTQYICLFGVTIVTEEEIENRDNSNEAINALVDYYNTNGLSTSSEFTSLVEAAQASLADVNHISKIDNYDTYQNILVQYNELVTVETKIEELRTVNSSVRARVASVNAKYDDETKALLDEIAAEIETANSLGITNDEISNYDLYLEALNGYNAMSAAAVEAFINKVAEANAVKGETSSYALINEAEELYNALNSYDKENETVVAAYNTLQEIKAAYEEYEASVTDNDVEYNYNEDGSVKSAVFVGTIRNFTSVSDIAKITMVITNEETNEAQEFAISTVYTSLSLRGEYIKNPTDGVRYICTKIKNTDGQYTGVEFSMTYTVEYTDGHVVTSNPFSVVIGA